VRCEEAVIPPLNIQTLIVQGKPALFVEAWDDDVPPGGWWLVADAAIDAMGRSRFVLLAPGRGLCTPWQWEAGAWFEYQDIVLDGQKIRETAWCWGGECVPVSDAAWSYSLFGDGPRLVTLDPSK
jgi:hypothetical protein